MSLTRSAMRRKTPAKSFFTMVELIAVISITAILLTITIRIMKTDSTKANAQVLGSALSFAESYAMSNTCFVIVEFSDSDGGSDYDTITVKEAENTGTTAAPVITEISSSPIQKEERFVAGSKFSTTPSQKYYFSATGEPITSLNRPLTSTTTFEIEDTRDSSTKAIVRIKPFNGKITYY